MAIAEKTANHGCTRINTDKYKKNTTQVLFFYIISRSFAFFVVKTSVYICVYPWFFFLRERLL